MGRKIDMKKIEDVTKCQVTFSKRRSSLMKKANEISVCCDVDVAFVAFSPSGRVSKFCNKKRIEDLLQIYVNLPPENRLNHLDNVQRKLEKLKNLDHIQSEASKLQYLEKQTENLELQIKKSGLELQILEANLRDFDLDPEQEPSLHLLTWCERNIKHSLERVNARKNELIGNLQTSHGQPNFQMEQTALKNQEGVEVSPNFNAKEPNSSAQSSTAGQILNKMVDPWISPFSTVKFHENNLPISSTMCDISYPRNICEPVTMITSDAENPNPFHIPQQTLVADHALMEQNTVNAWNNFSTVTFSNGLYNSTHSLSNMPPPRFTPSIITSYASDVTMGQHEIIQSSSHAIGNFRQFTNSGGEESSQVNSMHDHSEPQGATGDNVFWTSKIQKSNSWEWEDLFLDDQNFNFGGFQK